MEVNEHPVRYLTMWNLQIYPNKKLRLSPVGRALTDLIRDDDNLEVHKWWAREDLSIALGAHKREIKEVRDRASRRNLYSLVAFQRLWRLYTDQRRERGFDSFRTLKMAVCPPKAAKWAKSERHPPRAPGWPCRERECPWCSWRRAERLYEHLNEWPSFTFAASYTILTELPSHAETAALIQQVRPYLDKHLSERRAGMRFSIVRPFLVPEMLTMKWYVGHGVAFETQGQLPPISDVRVDGQLYYTATKHYTPSRFGELAVRICQPPFLLMRSDANIEHIAKYDTVMRGVRQVRGAGMLRKLNLNGFSNALESSPDA